jgi:hypothetical protein|tara:strand:+ start:246 stop:353 length:108 start_codon:yes stop_codon:yes gene_type:complete
VIEAVRGLTARTGGLQWFRIFDVLDDLEVKKFKIT